MEVVASLKSFKEHKILIGSAFGGDRDSGGKVWMVNGLDAPLGEASGKATPLSVWMGGWHGVSGSAKKSVDRRRLRVFR
jgi:hypothetical protein